MAAAGEDEEDNPAGIEILWEDKPSIEIDLLNFFKTKGRFVLGREALLQALSASRSRSASWKIAIDRENPAKLLYAIFKSKREIPREFVKMIVDKMSLEQKLEFINKFLLDNLSFRRASDDDGYLRFIFSDERVANLASLLVLSWIAIAIAWSPDLVIYIIEKIDERGGFEPRVEGDDIEIYGIVQILEIFSSRLKYKGDVEKMFEILNYYRMNTLDGIPGCAQLLDYAIGNGNKLLFDRILRQNTIYEILERYSLYHFVKLLRDLLENGRREMLIEILLLPREVFLDQDGRSFYRMIPEEIFAAANVERMRRGMVPLVMEDEDEDF